MPVPENAPCSPLNEIVPALTFPVAASKMAQAAEATANWNLELCCTARYPFIALFPGQRLERLPVSRSLVRSRTKRVLFPHPSKNAHRLSFAGAES
jgi:hypothetical protein